MKQAFLECAGQILKDPPNGELICPNQVSHKAKSQLICDLKCRPGYKASLKKVMCQSIGWRPPLEVKCEGSGITPGIIVAFLLATLLFLILFAVFYAKYSEFERKQKSNGIEYNGLFNNFKLFFIDLFSESEEKKLQKINKKQNKQINPKKINKTLRSTAAQKAAMEDSIPAHVRISKNTRNQTLSNVSNSTFATTLNSTQKSMALQRNQSLATYIEDHEYTHDSIPVGPLPTANYQNFSHPHTLPYQNTTNQNLQVMTLPQNLGQELTPEQQFELQANAPRFSSATLPNYQNNENFNNFPVMGSPSINPSIEGIAARGMSLDEARFPSVNSQAHLVTSDGNNYQEIFEQNMNSRTSNAFSLSNVVKTGNTVINKNRYSTTTLFDNQAYQP